MMQKLLFSNIFEFFPLKQLYTMFRRTLSILKSRWKEIFLNINFFHFLRINDNEKKGKDFTPTTFFSMEPFSWYTLNLMRVSKSSRIIRQSVCVRKGKIISAKTFSNIKTSIEWIKIEGCFQKLYRIFRILIQQQRKT